MPLSCSQRVWAGQLELQIRTVEMRRRVAGLSTELDALAARISGAFSVAELRGAEDDFRQLLSGDDLDAWADRLPFPVASVLIRYLAETDPRRQLDHLLDFFEGFASFCATILLSAARSDQARWEGLKGKIGRSGPGGAVPFLRPTFGAWVGVGRTVVRALESELDTADDGVRSSVLKVSDEAFATALVGRDLWNLLDRAGAIRNRQSHGGNVSTIQMQARLRELQELLGELHQHHGSAFNRVELIEPRESVYERRSYRFPRVRRLRGPNSVFREGEITSVGPLKHDSLYLVDKSDRLELALEVIPLFRLLPIPDSEDSACFFLNGVGGDGRFDFVSLHFTGRPIDPLVDPVLTELVEELSEGRAGR